MKRYMHIPKTICARLHPFEIVEGSRRRGHRHRNSYYYCLNQTHTESNDIDQRTEQLHTIIEIDRRRSNLFHSTHLQLLSSRLCDIRELSDELTATWLIHQQPRNSTHTRITTEQLFTVISELLKTVNTSQKTSAKPPLSKFNVAKSH